MLIDTVVPNVEAEDMALKLLRVIQPDSRFNLGARHYPEV
jgi:hypothetical protein